MAGNRNSGMCSQLWCVCAFSLPPRHYSMYVLLSCVDLTPVKPFVG